MGRSKPVAVPLLALLAALILYSSCQPVLAQTCSESVMLTTTGSPKLFEKCAALPKLGSSLAWTYNASTLLFEFAFQTKLPNANGWAGWGIHPSLSGKMPGASSLIAFNAANGTNLLPYYLSGGVTNATAIDLEVVENSTDVLISSDLTATFGATLKLKEGVTTLNQLWNVGESVDTFAPQGHSMTGDNLLSFSGIDIIAGTVIGTEVPHIDLKNSHGIINAIAWGILFPLGVMAARYMRPFAIFADIWFYIHVSCQVTAYILGTVGWGFGLKLGSYALTSNDTHQSLASAMFTLATVQVTSLFMRPKPDHKCRKYWNVYHHSIGFALIVLSIINVFKGIAILSPAKRWKTAYVVILIIIAAIALILEIGTWIAFYIERKRIPTAKLGDEAGYSNRPRPAVYGQDNGNQQWVHEPQL